MKNEKQNYISFQKYIIRTPLLSYNTISEKIARQDNLQDFYYNSVFLEAIYIASPTLYYELHKHKDGKLRDKKEIDKLQNSLLKYLSRSCTRCTPFGLFAGFSFGKMDEVINIKLALLTEYKKNTRLDMNYLCALAQDLAKHTEIKPFLKFFPNNSIYFLGRKLRYVDYYYKESNRVHNLSAVDNSEYLQKVLKNAKNGAYVSELYPLLVDEEITNEDAIEFIDELIHSQLLISELEPSITGKDFLEQIINILDKIENLNEIKNKLQEIKSDILELDNNIIGTATKKYKSLVQKIGTLETKFEEKYLFQVDMIKPTKECFLSKQIADDVLEGINFLSKLNDIPAKTNLTAFRNAFHERYEDREVPLLEALDNETGLGYLQRGETSGDITPLVDDMAFGGSPASEYDLKWNSLQSILHKKIFEVYKEKKYEVELNDADFKDKKENIELMADTISALIRIIEIPNEETEKPLIHLQSVGGSSAANLLGRFCHASEQLNNYVLEITAKEEELNSNVIFAEIVHLPESRTGNILLHPVFRKYEIPFLAKSSVGDDFQINLDDLMLSVNGNSIDIRSKRLNKVIIPRLSNAHNFSYNALPIYQFLCEMQTQNIMGGVGFSWGVLANEYSFLPRVKYKNLILFAAKWKIKQDEIKSLLNITDESILIESVAKWRNERKMPKEIVIADSDNELYVDLSNPLLIKMFLSVVKNRNLFYLEEFLFNPEKALVKNEEGIFTNEVILSYYKNKETKKI